MSSSKTVSAPQKSPPKSPRSFQVLTRWGHITRLEIGSDPILASKPNGQKYDTGERGPRWWKLRCDCGYEWKIFEHEFPGKLKLRSCNRPECEYSKPPPTRKMSQRAEMGRPLVYEERGLMKSVYMPKDVVQGAIVFANQHRLSFSRATVELMRIGLRNTGGYAQQEQDEQTNRTDKRD